MSMAVPVFPPFLQGHGQFPAAFGQARWRITPVVFGRWQVRQRRVGSLVVVVVAPPRHGIHGLVVVAGRRVSRGQLKNRRSSPQCGELILSETNTPQGGGCSILGIPTIATPTDSFRFAITHGENGLLAGDTEAWADSLTLLVRDPETRRRMGENARRHVSELYNPYRQGRVLVGILRRMLQA